MPCSVVSDLDLHCLPMSRFYRFNQVLYQQQRPDVRDKNSTTIYNHYPALVAQFDVHQTADQEVAGSTPVESATFFHGD